MSFVHEVKTQSALFPIQNRDHELNERLSEIALDSVDHEGNWSALSPEEQVLLLDEFPHLSDFFEIRTRSAEHIHHTPKNQSVIYPFKESI
jgi:hypothetical protein